MIDLDIPGFGPLHIRHLVLDFNGTLAEDGRLLPGVKETLALLAETLTVHVVTGDTHGTARTQLAGSPCEIVTLPKDGQAEAKVLYVNRLGATHCACIGNGRNDRLMLAAAGLGITVVNREGAASQTIIAGHIVSVGIVDALQLLENPKRLMATLRS